MDPPSVVNDDNLIEHHFQISVYHLDKRHESTSLVDTINCVLFIEYMQWLSMNHENNDIKSIIDTKARNQINIYTFITELYFDNDAVYYIQSWFANVECAFGLVVIGNNVSIINTTSSESQIYSYGKALMMIKSLLSGDMTYCFSLFGFSSPHHKIHVSSISYCVRQICYVNYLAKHHEIHKLFDCKVDQMILDENENRKYRRCLNCGWICGKDGIDGLPGNDGYPGELGLCKHEASRGRSGLMGPPQYLITDQSLIDNAKIRQKKIV